MDEIQDLRSFIGLLESMGEIKKIEGADWNLEIGGLTELLSEKQGPALLFDRIKGYPPGYRVLTNIFRTDRRLALALGLDTDLRRIELLNAWRVKLRAFEPVPVTLSEGGPVLENTMTEKDIDLTRFPAPIWHELDGVWGFVYGPVGPFSVIAIRQRYAGHAKQTALVACGAKAGVTGGKFVVVLDDDVDITDPQEVIWAMATRCNVREGVDIVKGVLTTPVEPAVPPASRSPRGNTMDRVLIDACRPYQWLDEFPRVNAFSKEYKQQLETKWKL